MCELQNGKDILQLDLPYAQDAGREGSIVKWTSDPRHGLGNLTCMEFEITVNIR